MIARFLASILAIFFLASSPAGAQELETKRLFHMVSPHYSTGPDLPQRTEPWTERDLFALLKPAEGTVRVLATFTLAGAEGRLTTTAMAQTLVQGQLRIWNIVVTGSPIKGTRDRTFVTETNGKKSTMAMSSILYMVGTEVPLGKIEENASAADVDALFAGTLAYLNSLL